MNQQYIVVGDPIAHSLSPQIHQLFAQQTGIDLEYSKHRVSEDEFTSFMAQFWATGGVGANVTVPLKGLAYSHADQLDQAAIRARAVNTLARRADGVWGYNTDGLGLCTDLSRRHQVPLQGARVLLLGAGGAARGVLQPLLDAGCAQIVIANRTTRAEALAAEFESQLITGSGYPELADLAEPPDVIINATSLALTSAAEPVVPLAQGWIEGRVCYDMSYGDKALFCRWASQHGARQSIDGLGMLVEQAAAAFVIWHNVAPQTQPVLDFLYQQLAAGKADP